MLDPVRLLFPEPLPSAKAPSPSSKPVVLITGPEGLIGSRLVERIYGQFSIVGLDRPPSPHDREHLDYVQVDLTKDDEVREAMRHVRQRHGSHIASVIHLAAYYDFQGEPSPLYEELTVQGTRRLLRELQEFQVEQFVFASSLLVMKESESGEPLSEESPTEGTWDYPASKLRAEEVIREERGKIPAVILRISGVYDEEGHSIPIGQQVCRIHEKQFESYFFPGDPEHGQAYVHLDDLTECLELTIEHRHELSDYETFLIAEPDVVSYDELQDQIGHELHGRQWPTIRIPRFVAKAGAWVQGKLAKEDDPEFIKPWMIDLADEHRPVEIGKANRLLDWHPKHRLRDTLPKMLHRLKADPAEWYRANGFPMPK